MFSFPLNGWHETDTDGQRWTDGGNAVPVATVPTRRALRSAVRGDLLVPRTRVKFGNRAFAVAGPEAWNSLPVDIRSSETVTLFKNRLKTYLFKLSY